MTGTVGELVLKDNREQTETLALSEAQAPGWSTCTCASSTRSSSRASSTAPLEALPTNEQLAERNREDSGMTRPELAVALAYSKIHLYAELLDSDVPEDPHLSGELERYFPAPLPQRFADQIRDHRLRREIIATQVINNMEHGGGITFAFRCTRRAARRRPRSPARTPPRGTSSHAHAVGGDRGARQQGRRRGSGAHAARGTPAGGARVALAARPPRAAARHRRDRALLLAGAAALQDARCGCSAPPTWSR